MTPAQDNRATSLLPPADAVGFYEWLGWEVLDRTNWKGIDTAQMIRDL
jgi:hypothetical protein